MKSWYNNMTVQVMFAWSWCKCIVVHDMWHRLETCCLLLMDNKILQIIIFIRRLQRQFCTSKSPKIIKTSASSSVWSMCNNIAVATQIFPLKTLQNKPGLNCKTGCFQSFTQTNYHYQTFGKSLLLLLSVLQVRLEISR